MPLYTPEPDVVHEVIGHAITLAEPSYADLYVAAGRAARRVEYPEALEFVSKVFWFSLEFGVVHEADGPKAYGAGLLSSYGEIEEFVEADLRPLDLARMGVQTYDITHYQPILFAAAVVAAGAGRGRRLLRHRRPTRASTGCGTSTRSASEARRTTTAAVVSHAALTVPTADLPYPVGGPGSRAPPPKLARTLSAPWLSDRRIPDETLLASVPRIGVPKE